VGRRARTRVGTGARRFPIRVRKRFEALAAALIAAALVVVGLGALGPAPSAHAANAVTVRISSEGIEPQVAHAAPGDTVTWVNSSASTVSVVASDVSFDSGPLAPGEQFQFAFTEARTVAYTVPQIFGASGSGSGSVIVAVGAAAPAPAGAGAPATGPLETPAAASQFAYTGSATAFNGLIGGLLLVLGAALIVSAQRFGLAAAITGLPFAFVPDDMLPSRRARRLRRARSRRAPIPWKRTDF
jgi:plastocyanin